MHNDPYYKLYQRTPAQTTTNTRQHAIPHKPTTKFLGITYDTSLSFTDHKHDIKQKCIPRLNKFRTLTGTDFGQHKEILTLVYKQYISLVLEYASPVWAPNLTTTHYNTLQTIHNNARRTMHNEILQCKHVRDKFLATASASPDHPCRYMLEHQHQHYTTSTIHCTP